MSQTELKSEQWHRSLFDVFSALSLPAYIWAIRSESCLHISILSIGPTHVDFA